VRKKFSLILFALILVLVNSQVQALILENDAVNIEAGNTKNIKLYADLPDDTVKVEFTLVFDSYDIPVYFSPTTGITDETPNGIKHTLILKTASSGETLLGSIIARVVAKPTVKRAGADLHSVNAYDGDGNKTALNNQNLYVTIGKSNNTMTQEEKPETTNTDKKTYNLLNEIKNGDDTILVVDDVFEYELKILNSVEELNLEAIPKNDKAKVTISNQKISELEDNKVTITVTNGKEKKDYIIKLKIIKDVPKVEIDDSEFKTDNGYKGIWIVMIILSGVGLFFGVVLNRVKK